LTDYEGLIKVDPLLRKIDIECKENLGVMKKVDDVIRKVLKLI
jgi:hypothetical protein